MRENEPLAAWTTLRLGGPAAAFVDAPDRESLYAAVREADGAGSPVLVLGGGSNLVVSDAGFDGRVVRVASSGVFVERTPGAVEVTLEAGEPWESFVEAAVTQGWAGVEALSGIPGLVGAVPIQNVGAYGQEVAETLVRVEALDRRNGRTVALTRDDCGFGYRTSRFKRAPGAFVVGAVTFRLPSDAPGSQVRYAELAAALGVQVGGHAAIAEIREAVLALRRRKGMVLDPDDHDTWSAGSFFTNPIVARDRVPAGAPAYPQPDGSVKTSAAWLIERAGISKGWGEGRVSVSTKHTLALTNRGGASAAELVALARQVRDRVRDRFDITLEAEPTLVGCVL